MIHEIATLAIQSQHIAAFRRTFGEHTHLLSRALGYCGHLLAQGIEEPQRFNLIVKWQSIADHTAFETSEDHQVFMMGLQAFFSEAPQVYHVEAVAWSADGSAVVNGDAGIGRHGALGR